MLHWESFAQAAPDLAAVGERLIDGEHLAWLATLRRSGAPRLHPISPIFGAGRIAVFVNENSPKRHDLLTDGRYMLHAPLGPDDEEFSIEGRAEFIPPGTLWDQIAAAAGHTIRPTDLLFAFQISRCRWAVWENVGQPNTRPIRRRWDAPAG